MQIAEAQLSLRLMECCLSVSLHVNTLYYDHRVTYYDSDNQTASEHGTYPPSCDHDHRITGNTRLNIRFLRPQVKETPCEVSQVMSEDHLTWV